MTFTKLHGTILDSSIWGESHATRIVWITMLAMADQDGVVHASVSGLARRAVVTNDECREALDKFLGPDDDSRDGTDGQRITTVAGGWLLLNHAQYRDRQTKAQVETAKRVRKHREKVKKDKKPPVTRRNTPSVTCNDVTRGNAISPSEADTEAEEEKKKTPSSSPKKRTKPKASKLPPGDDGDDDLRLRDGEDPSRESQSPEPPPPDRLPPDPDVDETQIESIAEQLRNAGMLSRSTIDEVARLPFLNLVAVGKVLKALKPKLQRDGNTPGLIVSAMQGLSDQLRDEAQQARQRSAEEAQLRALEAEVRPYRADVENHIRSMRSSTVPQLQTWLAEKFPGSVGRLMVRQVMDIARGNEGAQLDARAIKVLGEQWEMVTVEAAA